MATRAVDGPVARPLRISVIMDSFRVVVTLAADGARAVGSQCQVYYLNWPFTIFAGAMKANSLAVRLGEWFLDVKP